MKFFKSIFLFSAIGIFAGCQSSKVVTIWDSPNQLASSHPKIMVVGLGIPDNDKQREEIEDMLTSSLAALGYEAISSFKTFGPGGLSHLGEENTYLQLCNDGIDAVFTVVLLEKSQEMTKRRFSPFVGNSSYYYKRIWTYKKLREEDSSFNSGGARKYFWEGILFDLRLLEASCVMQSKSFVRPQVGSYPYINSFITRMKKINLLSTQAIIPSRAF